jgi:hypothetical protein
MRLYALNRVEAAEATEEFRNAQLKTWGGSPGAKSAVATKRTALMERIANMTVEVALVDNITERAIKSYNSWNYEKQIYIELEPASLDSDPSFLQRITVNYIRHELTRYDESLEEAAGKVGAHEARVAIKRKVLDAIASNTRHCALSAECKYLPRNMDADMFETAEQAANRERSRGREVVRRPQLVERQARKLTHHWSTRDPVTPHLLLDWASLNRDTLISMTDRLKQAFEQAATKLADEEQNQLADWLLKLLDADDNANWDATFAATGEKLDRLADAALDDFSAGRATLLDPDKL